MEKGIDLRELEEDSRCEEWKRQRIERGFSSYDIWNFDNYLTHVIADGLDILARKDSYPDRNFNSYEEWQKYLIKIAEDLREANELSSHYKFEEANKLLTSAFDRLTNVYWSLWT